jgi:hypothetical protein
MMTGGLGRGNAVNRRTRPGRRGCDKKPQARRPRLLDYLRPMSLRLALCGVLVVASIACSSPPYPVTKTCDAISEACHAFDHGVEGVAHDCHLAAHTGDEAVCVRMLPACQAACVTPIAAEPADGGTHDGGAAETGTVDAANEADRGTEAGPTADAGAPDHTPTGSADPACVPYCTCLTRQCTQPADAPAWVKDQDLCLAKCATFSAQERTCWSGFCDVNAASVPAHNCVHAWGGHGLDECQ